jgi:hypothetical protein
MITMHKLSITALHGHMASDGSLRPLRLVPDENAMP